MRGIRPSRAPPPARGPASTTRRACAVAVRADRIVRCAVARLTAKG
ncbi:hypothetical protein GBP346_A2628 [Burkholderia pseudomallei MSHR346]|nr:hypothetical protein GBP346_A2628 [Burkholderia pseudomallei MSHR346]EDS87159.1 hypothetical protein BURPSS13_P1167 [Burkholderia pseudomallei S13]